MKCRSQLVPCGTTTTLVIAAQDRIVDAAATARRASGMVAVLLSSAARSAMSSAPGRGEAGQQQADASGASWQGAARALARVPLSMLRTPHANVMAWCTTSKTS